MQSVLVTSICQMGIFMICAQAIIHFKPDNSYGKYLKMLVSVMILIQIFVPISSLFTQKNMGDVLESVQLFENKLEKSMEDAAKSAYLSESTLEQLVIHRAEELEIGEEQGINEKEGKEKHKGKTVKKIQIKVGANHETE